MKYKSSCIGVQIQHFLKNLFYEYFSSTFDTLKKVIFILTV
jgi:hypothetical protein